MRPSPRLLPLLIVLALAGPSRAQDAGLPLPDAPGGTTFPPVAERRATLADPRFPLTGTWVVAGSDELGELQGTITLSRRDGRLVYERSIQGPGRAGRAERGRGIVVQGRLFLREDLPRNTGLEEGISGGSARVRGHRQAIYGLRPDGRSLEGSFRTSDGAGRGREVLTMSGAGASDNDVRLLVDGAEMFGSLREALQSARRSIVLQTFIYTDDSTGRSVTRILCERARAGVDVKVLVDKVGDKMGGMKDELRAAGVQLVIQHGYAEGAWESVKSVGRGIWNGIKSLFGGSRPAPRERRGIFNHDHRKITVVDGAVAFCGGMNVAREYEHDWHDIHSSVRGSAVPQLESMFYERWGAAGGKGKRPVAPAQGPGPGALPVDVVGALPGLSTAIKDRYRREIQGARNRVLIENAYFLDDDVIDDLQAAARRGVRAVVILPPDENHDVPVVRDAFSFVRNDVVRSGVELYLYRDRMVHSKVASFDGLCATVGSSNLDPLALHKLAEANVFIPDARFTAELERRVFAADIPNSKRVVVQELSWWQKVKAGTLHFFRSFM